MNIPAPEPPAREEIIKACGSLSGALAPSALATSANSASAEGALIFAIEP